MKRLKELFIKWPNHVIVADCNLGYHRNVATAILKLREDAQVLSRSDSDVVKITDSRKPVKKEQPFFVTYYRHSIHGDMRVDSFADALAVAADVAQKDPERAKMWINLAFQMDDAPSKTNVAM